MLGYSPIAIEFVDVSPDSDSRLTNSLLHCGVQSCAVCLLSEGSFPESVPRRPRGSTARA